MRDKMKIVLVRDTQLIIETEPLEGEMYKAGTQLPFHYRFGFKPEDYIIVEEV